MDNFVHLHVHSEYSLLDGACRIKQLVGRVKELGQTAVAVTDHGVMNGVVDLYKAAKAAGIRPVLGCEVYVAPRTMADRVHKIDNRPHHLVLLCKNKQGYQNLCKLSSEGFINGFYGKPRVDKALLEQYHDGIIALSACLAGEIPQQLLQGNYEQALAVAQYYQQVFGKENYYIELQNHGIDEQVQILPELIRLGRETGIPMVATNDAHYLRPEDARSQHVLMCIQTNHTIYEEGGMEFSTEEFYVKSREQMEGAFAQSPQSAIAEALDNTVKIAQQCEASFDFDKLTLPFFQAPGEKSNEDFFLEICKDGLTKHYGQAPSPEILERLDYEVNVIKKMGYVEFYLITYDFIHYAKTQGIPVGPGRGSGAGSLCAYCMGITDIDPIKYNLLFERFLNPERVTMPDFDIDFCYVRRPEVIDYVIEKYGKEKVAQIITFGTMAARAVIRDVGRVMGLPYAVPDRIAKMIPAELNITIERALKISAELREDYETNEQTRELIDSARALEGMPRHASTHAAGVVVTPEPVVSYLPLQKNDDAVVTQFAKETVEELGLLKIDFLGLRTLTVIDDTCKMVRAMHADFSIEQIDYEDVNIFQMLARGDSNCVFQFESTGMKQVLTQLKPEAIEDLIAVVSLYRPGPMESIPRYVRNRHAKENVTYKHPLLKPILEVTYGCIIYQEQVMQICRSLAGFSYGRADLVRRAMAKKKAQIMENERSNFIYGSKDDEGNVLVKGCIANGVPEAVAKDIYDEMSSFASYAFNKSHAAGYAILAYQTAFLKYYHPKEFMAAMLTTYLENSVKVAEYIDECKSLHIQVLPPHINQSAEGFAATAEGIRFGLLAVKNIGRGLISALIAERESGGRYTSFYDFCERMFDKEMNKRALESLIKAGALDGLDCNRRQMLQSVESILSNLQSEKKNAVAGQLSLFDNAALAKPAAFTVPQLAEFPSTELMSMEKETTGLYLSGHPMDDYREYVKQIGGVRLSQLQKDTAMTDGQRIKVLALVAARQNKVTKNGDNMAFVRLEDWFSSIEMLVFPKTLLESGALLQEGAILVVQGRLSFREEEEPKLLCERVSLPEKEKQPGAPSGKEKKVYLKLTSTVDVEQVTGLLQQYVGAVKTVLFDQSAGKYLLAPQSCWIDPTEQAIDALRDMLGADNVVIR